MASFRITQTRRSASTTFIRAAWMTGTTPPAKPIAREMIVAVAKICGVTRNSNAVSENTRRRRRDRSIFNAAKPSEGIITAPPMHAVTAGRVSRFNKLARHEGMHEFQQAGYRAVHTAGDLGRAKSQPPSLRQLQRLVARGE